MLQDSPFMLQKTALRNVFILFYFILFSFFASKDLK